MATLPTDAEAPGTEPRRPRAPASPPSVVVFARSAGRRQAIRGLLPDGLAAEESDGGPGEDLGHGPPHDLVLLDAKSWHPSRPIPPRRGSRALLVVVDGSAEEAEAWIEAGASDVVLASEPLALRKRRVSLALALCTSRAGDELVSHSREAGARLPDLESLVASRTAELAAALRALDSRHQFIETTLDAITAGIVAIDERQIVVLANRAAHQILEVAPGHCVGLPLRSLIGDAPELSWGLASVRKGGQRRTTLSYTTPAGRTIELGITVISVERIGLSGQFGPAAGAGSRWPSPLGAPSEHASPSFLLVFRDIGVEDQLEKELRRVRALAALGEMAAGFAHEVRNPLAGIRALGEILLSELPEADERREYVRRILGLLGRLERLVRSSLHFAQPKSPAPRACDVAPLVEDAFEILAPRLAARQGRPRLVRSGPVAPAFADPDQMTEVVVILVENALDVVGDPGGVVVTVGPAESDELLPHSAFVAIEVADNGPGIPEALQARVFDPFFTTKAKGTGLGLPIAQRLVRQSHGHLRLVSRPGETRFTILLPIERT